MNPKPDLPFRESLLALARRFIPAPLAVQPGERWRIVVGALLGIFFTGLVSHALHPQAVAWMVAPIGASAVLVFGLPSSPLAQPWPVVGGNTLSMLVGTACAVWVPDTLLAATMAVSLAIVLMLYARCLHPPGGAAALLAVLSHNQSWGFAVFPMLGNSVLLVFAGLVFNGLSGRTYPYKPSAPKEPADPHSSLRFTRADLDAALHHYNQLVDIAPEALIELLQFTEAAAYQRTLGELRCADIMTANPHCVQFGTELGAAWAVMRKHRVKALPVVDRTQRVVGIVTVADFLKQADMSRHQGLVGRLNHMLKPSGRTHNHRPEVVGQIMTRTVRVARAQRHAVELLPLFSEEGHHHLPIIDDDNRLVGILTQSDLVRSLSMAVRP